MKSLCPVDTFQRRKSILEPTRICLQRCKCNRNQEGWVRTVESQLYFLFFFFFRWYSSYLLFRITCNQEAGRVACVPQLCLKGYVDITSGTGFLIIIKLV